MPPADLPRLVDWALTFVAAVLAALLLGVSATAPPAPGGASVAEVRELEQEARLLDAEAALPPEVREAIGLAAGPGEAATRAMKELEALVDRVGAPPRLLLVAAALAVSHGHGELALRALDHVAEDPEALDRRRLLVDALHELARGRPAASADALASELRAVGASRWLVHRVRAQDAEARGDAPAATLERQAATDLATRYVKRFTSALVVVLTLGLVGVLLIAGWPLVRRALDGAGFRGLEGTTSPFLVASTHRVMVAWFLAFMLVGLGLAGLAGGLGGGAEAQAYAMNAQALVQGGVALALIQRFGRRPEDSTPLFVPLRLGAGPAVGGWTGWLVATVAGTAVAVVVVFAAMVLTGLLGAEPTRAQPALELFAEEADLASRLLIGVAVIVFAPLFEEILFRGFLYRNLRDLVGPAPAMVGSGLLFGLAHLDPQLLLPLAALGTTLAFLYERSGSLLVPVAVHALWNAGQLAMVVLIVSG